MATSKLSVLALPHPIILLPASRSTLPVTKEIGESLLSIIEESDILPIVAAIPLTAPSTSDVAEPSLSEWGTAARVLRLVKPRNSRQPYIVTLHGLTRVRLIHTSKKKITSDDLLHLPVLDVEYSPPEKLPSHEGVEKFKQSALRLLDRLANDSPQQSRKEVYHKITSMLDDIADARTPWMADLLIGTVTGEYNDKLGEFTFDSVECDSMSMSGYWKRSIRFSGFASVDDGFHLFSLGPALSNIVLGQYFGPKTLTSCRFLRPC
jgi:ATP-dependent Lon protease